jgi:transcriptional adapter 3
LQKKDAPKANKKKKKQLDGVAQANGNGKDAPPVPLPNPAAIGLGPDEENKLVVNEALSQLVDTRRKWVDVVGGVFDQKEREMPGRIWGIPRRSVYEGIQADGSLQPAAPDGPQPLPAVVGANADPSRQTTSKGKERARTDDMDEG